MVDSVYYLVPNYDDSQDMAYENGDKPDIIEFPPDAVQDLSATALGPNSIELDWSPAARATSYAIQRSPDNVIWSDIDSALAPPYVSNNLQQVTPYYYRLFAVNADGYSGVSNTATDTTDATVPSVGDIFVDTFALQPVGVTVGSGLNPPSGDPLARWWYFGGGSLGETCKVGDNKAYSDTKSLEFTFTPSVASNTCEAGIKLGSVYQQLSLEFQLYIPDGNESYGGAAYKHRDRGITATNCKIFRLYHTTYEPNNHKIGASIWRVSDDISELKVDFNLHGYGTGPIGPGYNIITAATKGTWIKLRFDIVACSPTRNTTITTFLNGAQILSDTYDQYSDGWDIGYDRGYLMGAFNSGFSETTKLLMDDVNMVAT